VGIKVAAGGGVRPTTSCKAEVSTKTNVAFPNAFVFLGGGGGRKRGCG
jgi:hypothetical protein